MPYFKNAVITIGTFDGVHTGHQQIIEQLKREAEKYSGETVIITFDPHPRKIVHGPQKEIRLINTLEEKIELLAKSGIDHLVVIPFTTAFSQLSAQEYIRDFLIDKFHPHTIIIGYDHRFGRGRTGDYHLMEEMSSVFTYRLCEIPVHVLNAISVSSTRIRQAIIDCEIGYANELLGYSFFFSGSVIEGEKLGEKIGFPTANLRINDPEKLIPGDGVYAVHACLAEDENGVNTGIPVPRKFGKIYSGMMNIGFRPTVDGSRHLIEVHLFDFAEIIYGLELRVFSEFFLRKEVKFNGIEALREQLFRDQEEAGRYLKV
ncbi:MAG: bifunctional riboflavin kinase/FAD synthetase [Chitinophagales bacterium]